jgi:hypothetical protein
MIDRPRSLFSTFGLLALCAPLLAQEPPGGPPGGFPGGFGGGPGGGPGGMNQTTAVLAQFDADRNGRLDATERQAARAWLKKNRSQRGRRGPGGPGGQGGAEPATAKQGQQVTPADVASYPDRPLFDPDLVRTFFVEIPGDDWFAELNDFYRTDVEVPVTITIDGITYRDVGLGFRGNTSFMMAPGRKKSLDFAFDHADSKQSLHGVRNLDLLNAHTDASFVREMLHGWLANRFLPAPRTALVRVVINGEDHGIYVAVQQFDKDFTDDHFGSKKGDRWKVPPDFSGGGGLKYLGDDPAAYQRSYQIKSKDDPAAWQALVDLCAVLEQSPPDRLEAILPQHLDIDGALWFLACDNALGDDDGYHARASDYLLYRDPKGRFHPLARDNNEILLGARGRGPGGPMGGPGAGEGPPAGGPEGRPRPDAGGGAPPGAGPGGPGGRRGGGPGSAASSPLQMANRADRPLLRRLLEVPVWKERYLANLRAIAFALDDAAIAPRLASWQLLLEPVVKKDVHALYGYEAFAKAFAPDEQGAPAPGSLRAIIQSRRQALLADPAMQGAWPTVGDARGEVKAGATGLALHVVCTAQDATSVQLRHDRGEFGAFASVPMHDDGQHGDGKAGDGVYGAMVPADDDKKDSAWRWYVEAAAASGHLATAPAGNGAQPFVVRPQRSVVR